jgi:hypothetical protein
MKPCSKCKYFQIEFTKNFEISSYTCYRKASFVIDIVTGGKIYQNVSLCEFQRESINPSDCGPEGKFFKSKWWYFWG